MQKCRSPAAVSTIARTSRSQCASRKCCDEPVAHVVGDRVALVGAVDREPEHAVLELRRAAPRRRSRLRSTGSLTCVTTNASRATAPRGRTTNGLMSSSRTSPARSSARRCTFMIVSTSASTSAGFAPRTPSSSLKPLSSCEHAARFVGVERRHAERHVAEHLDEDAAEPDRDDRPEELVVRDADRASRRRRSPSRTRARRRCGPSWSALRGLARAARRTRRAPPSATPTPTCTSPTSLLCSRSGDETFITTGKPIALRRASPPPSADVHSSSLRRLDAVRREQLLRVATPRAPRRAPGRRGACAPSSRPGDGAVGAVVERRAVARRERPVVGVGLHRRDAVVERAERRAGRRRAGACSTCRRCPAARPRSRRSASSWSSTPR